MHIFAIESGINWRVLNWAGVPDDYDLAFRGKRVDVKSTGLHGKYLLWSKAKVCDLRQQAVRLSGADQG